MPKGTWRKVAFEGEAPDPNLPELYVKAGSIIPTGPITQFVDESPLTEVTLFVSLDSKGEATGTLYEDASEGFGYQKGEFRRTTFKAKADGNDVKVTTSSEGSWQPPKDRTLKVIVLK